MQRTSQFAYLLVAPGKTFRVIQFSCRKERVQHHSTVIHLALHQLFLRLSDNIPSEVKLQYYAASYRGGHKQICSVVSCRPGMAVPARPSLPQALRMGFFVLPLVSLGAAKSAVRNRWPLQKLLGA